MHKHLMVHHGLQRRGYAPAQVESRGDVRERLGHVAELRARALNWLHTAAAQRFARAYTNLGILYLNGNGVHQDYVEAVRWFQLGADAGDSDAQTNLAMPKATGWHASWAASASCSSPITA